MRLRVVSARELGWSPATAWFLLSKDKAHGPFTSREAAIAASERPKGSFGYGNVAPDLSFLFPRRHSGAEGAARLKAQPTILRECDPDPWPSNEPVSQADH